MGSNRWAHLIFVFGGLVLAFIMVQTIEWIWSYFGSPKDLIVNGAGIVSATLITLYTWRNKNTFEKATNITMELKKVTWPTRKETSAATIVVIITVCIAATFLAVFDMIWSWTTNQILTP